MANLRATLVEFAAEIQESKYEQVSAEEVVAMKQSHLTMQQQGDLAKILSTYPKLFSGKLGLYPHCKIHLDLNDDAKPVHIRPYAVPHQQEIRFKELQRLCKIGVLERCGVWRKQMGRSDLSRS
jgi:hypothetical protein